MGRRKKGRKVALVAGCALLVVLAMVGTYWKEIRSWYALWRDFERLGRNEQSYPEYQHRQTGIVFVSLPGGTFDMGSPESEEGRAANEGPMHTVTLSPFLIAKYEVSQAEWVKVMGGNSSRFKGDTLPVERVSWEDCQEFCRKTGLSLPTEAQWEYACRADTKTPIGLGETVTTDQVNYDGNYPYGGAPKGEVRQCTVTVDSFEPNARGLHQMHGNVWEWCEDVWDEEFYKKPEATQKNPVRRSGSEVRVVRGGGWSNAATNCRSAYRHYYHPSNRHSDLGFRPARSLPRAGHIE